MSIVSRTIAYASRSSPVVLSEKEIELPPAANYIVVELDAMSLNPVDMKMKGMSLVGGGIAGRDFAGTVRHVASNLTGDYAPGDRVCGCLHSFSPKGFVGSYALVEVTTNSVVPIPKQFSPIEAAAFPLVFLTAWEMLANAAIDAKQSVLILGGATAVGTMAIQILKLKYKVNHVVATCSPRSFDYVKSFGADEVIDYSGDLPGKLVSADTKYSAIIDAVGGRDVAYIAGKILAPTKHKYNFLSVTGDKQADGKYEFGFGTVAGGVTMAGRSMFGRMWGVRYKLIRADNSWVKEGTAFLRECNIQVPIDSVYAYEDALKAWSKVEATKARGKVVIEFKAVSKQ